MQKLIIIGNGFDLSHGLKTSYKDFLLDYLSNVKESLIKKDKFNDQIFEIQGLAAYPKKSIIDDTMEIYDWFKNQIDQTQDRIGRGRNADYYADTYREFNFNINTASNLFYALLANQNFNWVDVENEYFNVLLNNKKSKDSLIKINNDLVFIKNLLIRYLERQIREHHIKINEKYLDYFLNDYEDGIYFLNFNYTKTIEKYTRVLKNDNKLNLKVNYIHGDISENYGSPIFGIGDEHHEMYKQLKDTDNFPTLFKYSKSVEYMKAMNYRNLEKFINTNKFSVEVYGHSCGLSDRTLLKHLFEHRSCTKIKLYHHGGIDDYWSKSLEVLRHFDNPNEFRNKLEPFSANNYI